MSIDFDALDALTGSFVDRGVFRGAKHVAMARLYYRRIPTCRIADTLHVSPDTVRRSVRHAESLGLKFMHELTGAKADALEAELKKELETGSL